MLAVAAVVLAFAVTPATASAHLRSGTVAVDYLAGVISPNAPAYAAVIYQSDHGLSLTIKPGHTVTVLGYLGEPAFRLDRAGLSVKSPTDCRRRRPRDQGAADRCPDAALAPAAWPAFGRVARRA